jgi:hypothetical protein
MPRLNWKVIADNLTEAREELEKLEQMATETRSRTEGRLQVGLEHAYFHLTWHGMPVVFRRLDTRA